MILELDADLPVRRLLTEERVFQQLVSVRPLSVVFDQTHTDKVDKLLRPSHANKTIHSYRRIG